MEEHSGLCDGRNFQKGALRNESLIQTQRTKRKHFLLNDLIPKIIKHSASFAVSSSDANQFNVEDEGGACGNAGLGETAVAHFCGDVDFPAVADVHVLHGNDPTLDKFVQTASQRSGVPTGVKRETIDGAPGVVSSNHTVQCGGLSLAGTGMEHLVVNASGQGFNIFFGGLFLQPARVGESVCQVVVATACTCFSGHDVMVWMVNDFFISNYGFL